MKILKCCNKTLDLSAPGVMGILNVTPDSFYDGGCHLNVDEAVRRAEKMVEEGASIIDIGAESTRPNAIKISHQEELDRLMPVLEKLVGAIPAVISVDTRNASVMKEAILAGADMINDVSALRSKGALELISKSKVAVCLMHMKGTPDTMQIDPQYDDVVEEVSAFLIERVRVCTDLGIDHARLMIDPGFAFGKTVEHNLIITNHLEKFCALSLPVVFGASRKSTIGIVLDVPVKERLYGGLALAAMAVERGAKVIRTHDVKATMDIINMVGAVRAAV